MSIKKLSNVYSLGSSIFGRVTAAKIDEIITELDQLTAGGITITNVELGDGTAALPAVSFAADLNTGIYRISADRIGISTGGVLALDISTTVAGLASTIQLSVLKTTDATTSTTGSIITAGGMGIAKALYVGTSVNATTYITSGNGSVSLPAIGPVSDPDSGLYVIGANNLGIALGGAKVLDMLTTGVEVTGRIVKRPAATTVAANSGTTLTAAMMLSGYVLVTGTTGSLALDTIANITTALGGVSASGTTFEFTLNTMGATPMTAGNVVTITAPASCTFMKQFNTTDVGSAFIPTVTATAGIHLGTFRVTFDTAASIVVQRIG